MVIYELFATFVKFLIDHRSIVAANGVALLCLALHRAWIFWKEDEGLTGFGLAQLLIRDQVIYFVA